MGDTMPLLRAEGDSPETPRGAIKMRLSILTCMTVLLLGLTEALGGELRAGVARVDLTPPLDIKATLGGYGARMSKPAVGVHDRVLGKALVLADGAERFALVTADVLAFPPGFEDAVAEALAGAGWTKDRILLLPSHSH